MRQGKLIFVARYHNYTFHPMSSSLPSVLWYCWLGLLTCNTVSHITYTVLVETWNLGHPCPLYSTLGFGVLWRQPRGRWTLVIDPVVAVRLPGTIQRMYARGRRLTTGSVSGDRCTLSAESCNVLAVAGWCLVVWQLFSGCVVLCCSFVAKETNRPLWCGVKWMAAGSCW